MCAARNVLIALDGLCFVAIVHFEGNVFDRNREFGWLIDERANSAQREALSMIVLGKAGGSFAAWADLTITTIDLLAFWKAPAWLEVLLGADGGALGPLVTR